MRYPISILLLLFSIKSFAQKDSSNFERTHSYIEAGTFLSTSNTLPFWLRANQYGIVPDKGPALATFRGGYFHDYAGGKSASKKYDWGYGIDAAINLGAENKIYLPEAYVKVKLNKFEFYAGRRREIFGLVDTTLTSGSYIWSGNALPMPKLQISIPDYLPLKFTNSLFAIKGGYAHGWFDNSGVVKDYYLHQKWFYTRLGKPNWRVKMYAGFNHQVQWGGYSSVPVSQGLAVDGKHFPSLFTDYISVVTGRAIRANHVSDTTNLANFDKENRVGNHLGSIDFGVEFILKTSKILIYRQNIFETGGLYKLLNIEDGLNGISWRKQSRHTHSFTITAVNFEFLFTKSQSGSIFNSNFTYLLGREMYFDNIQYNDGWIYEQKTIGTPFLTPYNSINGNLPQDINVAYKKPYMISNNRIRMFHLAFLGESTKLRSQCHITYNQNYGTYDFPFPNNTNQFSLLEKVEWIPKKNAVLRLYTAFSMDLGKLYNNNIGIYLGIKKDW